MIQLRTSSARLATWLVQPAGRAYTREDYRDPHNTIHVFAGDYRLAWIWAIDPELLQTP